MPNPGCRGDHPEGCVCVFVCVCACVYLYVHVHLYVCASACVYVYMYICIYVHLYVYMCAYVEARGRYHLSLPFLLCFTPLRQGSPLSLELISFQLGCPPAIPRDPPVSVPSPQLWAVSVNHARLFK